MADLIFLPVADQIKDSTYSVYDGASGTGGMLTVSQDRLLTLAERNKRNVSIHLFGQESQPETYAIAKADMLLKGKGVEADNIVFGSTLSTDGFPSHHFDFMLSNPPYGKSWKMDADKMGGKKGIQDTRFVTQFAGIPDFSMIPRTSDGQLLFLLNNVSKMKETTALGSHIAEVHNGSSLFTGDAGQGESNARRYMIERDLVEAIIALPNNMFYNTGIGTFIWILSNCKAGTPRESKIQLINATSMKSPLRKNLGQKNCEITGDIRREIIRIFMAFEENKYSNLKELLFQFKRCMVHFAVDDARIKFCTKLDGKASWFLPFDKGYKDGAGNPPNPDGIMTDYLWKQIFTKTELAGIIENYAQVVEKVDPDTKKKSYVQIFPRYHQLAVVKSLLADVKENGVGKRYLIQHSAGSGKSNSIAWLAHQLVGLEVSGVNAVDSVIVVTDRVNLDKQIEATIKQFAQVRNIVAHAERSGDLRTAISMGKKIISSTVHKFPFILDDIGSSHMILRSLRIPYR
jgi:type I restriction-modification system DNA methylase subunit